MKRKSLTVRIPVILMIIALALTACGTISSPERTAEKFFGAVKAGDIEKSIECFTPSAQAQYKAGLAISDALFHIDSGALLNGVLGWANASEYENYDFKVVGTKEIDSTHAIVTVDVYVDGQKDWSDQVQCVKLEGKWYIEQ